MYVCVCVCRLKADVEKGLPPKQEINMYIPMRSDFTCGAYDDGFCVHSCARWHVAFPGMRVHFTMPFRAIFHLRVCARACSLVVYVRTCAWVHARVRLDACARVEDVRVAARYKPSSTQTS